jgi:hypothetical protein
MTLPADSARPPASTVDPTLADLIDTVRATLPVTSATCRYGGTYCIHGAHPHEPCSSGWIRCSLPGERGPVGVLELSIEGYEDGKPPVLAFSADGHEAAELTVAEARAAVAAVLDHLPRMLTMIDQYDAILGGAQ